MNTHNLCFEKKYEKYQNYFLVVKFSIYLNRHISVMLNIVLKQHEDDLMFYISFNII